jgi:Tol biopolymer transport system component
MHKPCWRGLLRVLVTLLVLVLAPPYAPARAQDCDPGLIVAWIDDGTLTVWRAADPMPRPLASGDLIALALAPDGAQIATLRDDARRLWLTALDGSRDRPVLDADVLGEARRVAQMAWATDARTLYVNTLRGEGMDIRPADDLWRVDAASGEAARLLADGAGGQIVPSPDGAWLALVSAGEYTPPDEPARTPATIAFYDPASGARTVALEFPAPATASSRRWHAQPRWTPDGSGVLVAVPPAALVYDGADSRTALWFLPVEGEPQRLGVVAADFFGLPVFSPDGSQIAYLAPRSGNNPNRAQLVIARQDGSDPATVATRDDGRLFFAGWQGERFLFAQGDGLFMGGADGEPVPFPGAGIAARDVLWPAAGVYVYSARTAAGYVVGCGQIDGAPQPIHTLDRYPPLSAVIAPD